METIEQEAIDAETPIQNVPPDEAPAMKKTAIVVVALWLLCGYFSSAMWTADFYNEYGAPAGLNIETKGSAARSSLLWFVGGPISAFVAFATCNYKPMWDWPLYLFDYK